MNAANLNQESVVLNVQPRQAGKPRQLRQAGLVPLELYGHDTKNISYQTNAKELALIVRKHGTTTLIDLAVDGTPSVKVLLREPQLHPVSHAILHLDLYKVNLKEKITSEVPLVFAGQSPAIDDLGGTLIESKQEIEVECLPADLPHELTIDISSLKTFEDVLHIKDIPVPAGVTILAEADEVIASVAEPRSEEELAALDEAIEEDVEGVAVVEEKAGEAGAEGAEGAEAGAAAEPNQDGAKAE